MSGATARLPREARARGVVRLQAVRSRVSRANRHHRGHWPATPASPPLAGALRSARQQASERRGQRDTQGDPPRRVRRRARGHRGAGDPPRAHHGIGPASETGQETRPRVGEHSTGGTPRHRPRNRRRRQEGSHGLDGRVGAQYTTRRGLERYQLGLRPALDHYRRTAHAPWRLQGLESRADTHPFRARGRFN